MDNNTDIRRSNQDTVRNTAIGFTVGMLFGGLVDMLTGDLGVFTILGMLMGSILGRFGLKRVHWMEYPPRAILWLVASGLFYLTVLLATFYLIDRGTSPSIESLLPYAPLLPGMFFLLAMGYALSNLDELQRRIQVEAIAIGFGMTVLTCMTIGLLGLTGTTQPNWLMVPLIMTLSWLIGKLWTRWYYR